MDYLNQLIRKKWLVLGVILLLLLLFLIFLSSQSRKKEGAPPEVQPDSLIPTTSASSFRSDVKPTARFTAEQLKAIEEQSKADETVGNREIEIKTKYPWFIRLPLRGEKYFVYFERNRAIFVAALYPKAGDNVEEIKAEVVRRLKEDTGVSDVENYPFDWKITPE